VHAVTVRQRQGGQGRRGAGGAGRKKVAPPGRAGARGAAKKSMAHFEIGIVTVPGGSRTNDNMTKVVVLSH
jgi:hypothetical protein